MAQNNNLTREIVFDDHTCFECDRYCKNRRALGNHLHRAHEISIRDYTLKHYFHNVIPKCKCGCLNDVLWHKTAYRFNNFLSGHNRDGFTSTNQPVFTDDMIKRRNKSIKVTYSLHNDEITLKRAHSMIKRLQMTKNPLPSVSGSVHDDILKRVKCLTSALRSGGQDLQFKDDKHSLITREELIRINETGIFPAAPGREFTRSELLPAVREFFREYVKAYGWFYPVQNETLSKAISSVKNTTIRNDNVVSSLSSAGNSYLKGTFKSFWNVDAGPVNAFWNDKKLDSVLKYRLGLNTSKLYDYKLSDGQEVSCHETFDINIKNVRFGFIVQRAAVSWFKPGAAFAIYKKFLLNIDHAPVVWDPSCGFGARLLGFAGAYPEGVYIGTDPANETFNDLMTFKNSLLSEVPSLSVDLRKQGSEAGLTGIDDNSVDFVFTSPPYFDKEKYFDEPGQCWKEHPTRRKWLEAYLLPTFVEAFRVLQKGAAMVINIDSSNVDLVVEAAIRAGFDRAEREDLGLSIGRDHFVKHSQAEAVESKKFEPVIAFRKPRI